MTILSLAVGSDRILLVQDSGTFEHDPPHRQTGTSAKILAMPPWRMIAGGAGHVGTLRRWQQLLLAGVAGDNLERVAEHGPPLLRDLAPSPTGAAAGTLIVVAAIADGQARAIMLRQGHGFRPQWLGPGERVIMPSTADQPPELEPLLAAAPRSDMPPVDHAPDEPQREVDWLALCIGLRRAVRLQVAQRRAPFAPPIVSALLHPDGIDLREFVP